MSTFLPSFPARDCRPRPEIQKQLWSPLLSAIPAYHSFMLPIGQLLPLFSAAYAGIIVAIAKGLLFDSHGVKLCTASEQH